MPEDAITMRPEHTQQIARLMFLKQYVESQVASLNGELAKLVLIAYGVDINDGDWHVDLEKGVLSRANEHRYQS